MSTTLPLPSSPHCAPRTTYELREKKIALLKKKSCMDFMIKYLINVSLIALLNRIELTH